MKWQPLLALIAMTSPLTAGTVAFDWFEYRGEDTVYADNPLQQGEFHNPILPGFYPDPSIVRVGDDFYIVNSTFAWFPGVPIFHSRDLVNWTQIGHVLDRPSQLDLDGLSISRGVFAPTISYHEGTFYMVTTLVDKGGNFYVTAKDPAGPWSDPVWMDFEGIDPSLFFDPETGRAWMLNNGAPEGEPLYEGHRAIWLQEFDPGKGQLTGPRRVIVNGGVDISEEPVWIEGPHLFRRGEWVYLHCAEGGTSVNHRQVVFRSRHVEGPYEPWEGNPILTQRLLSPDRPNPVSATGHADFVELPNGEWWTVFLGTRPYEDDFYNTGRQTFLLPVHWTEDGWPDILPVDQPVPFKLPVPSLPVAADPGALQQGNFSWRDDFGGSELDSKWAMLRTPRGEAWWMLGQPAGVLQIKAQPVSLTSTESQPSFLGRRQQHHCFSAILAMEAPAAGDLDAGLVLFLDETHYYFIGVRRTPAGLRAFVEQADGVVSQPVQISLPEWDSVQLRVRQRGTRYQFSLSGHGTDWKDLGHFDARILSIAHSWGFTGVMMGPYARPAPVSPGP